MAYTPTMPRFRESIRLYGGSHKAEIPVPAVPVVPTEPAIARTVYPIPTVPVGVRLVRWLLKEPPVAIEACAVVVNPALFARTTLEQLAIALAHPERWVGWSVPQLIDRLAQVGVVVMLEQESRPQ